MSLIKKALEMFMSKHNQVLVVGNSRLGRVKIPSCIACDRPLIEKVRLDTVVSKDHHGGSIMRSAGLGGSGMNNSLSHWGDSDEEDGGGGGHITNNNSLILVNIHNNNQVVGGNSIASSRGGTRGDSSKGKRQLSSMIRLPSAGTDGGARPRTGGRPAAGGNGALEDPYILRGGFKMPRPTTSDGGAGGVGGTGSMMMSSSTTHLPSVNNH
jgi:hypothetical protein